MNVVSFTPVRQDDRVLELFLRGLDAQGVESWFYDDNDHRSELLEDRHRLPKVPGLPKSQYRDHQWDGYALNRITQIKQHAVEAFLKSPFEWLFMVDSDILMRPGLVEHLLSVRKPIVSAVFWTVWPSTGPEPMPNVWDFHQYKFQGHNEWRRFRKPGHYRVGGLGACTLIERSVFEAGVSFAPVNGVPFPGEDRHFCVRAAARDIPLVACSHLELFHVYTPGDLPAGQEWMTDAVRRD